MQGGSGAKLVKNTVPLKSSLHFMVSDKLSVVSFCLSMYCRVLRRVLGFHNFAKLSQAKPKLQLSWLALASLNFT